jgi:3-mercaptopyruvate sulfurtransferase SseA
MLKRIGIQRVRPLQGGFEGWLKRGYPTDAVATARIDEGLTGISVPMSSQVTS